MRIGYSISNETDEMRVAVRFSRESHKRRGCKYVCHDELKNKKGKIGHDIDLKYITNT